MNTISTGLTEEHPLFGMIMLSTNFTILKDYIEQTSNEITEEQAALHTWWTMTRPARGTVSDVSGRTAWQQNRARFNTVEENRAEMIRVRKAASDLHKQFEQEDNEMLIRLVTIRMEILV